MYVFDVWIDYDKILVGYEIVFIKVFYKYEVLRLLEEIEKDIFVLEEEIEDLIKEIID